jgi:hypothetical protein
MYGTVPYRILFISYIMKFDFAVLRDKKRSNHDQMFGGITPLIFCLFLKFLQCIQYIRSIIFIIYSSLVSSVGKPPWGAIPRIELKPALQQADALPTEQRRTQSYPIMIHDN